VFSTTSLTIESDRIISATTDAGTQYISQDTVAIIEQRDFYRYKDPGKSTTDAGTQYISQDTVAIIEQRDFSRYKDPGKSHTKCPENSRPVTWGVPSDEKHTYLSAPDFI